MAIGEYVSVSEAAEFFGVTPQRMHQLIKSYEVPVEKQNPRFSVIRKTDLKRIPKRRPAGVHRKKT